MNPHRREAILQLLFGSGALGLRAFVTGVPLAYLINPRQAAAAEEAAVRLETANPNKAQFLVVSSSQAGDPLNCNVPGTYLDPKVAHPTDPSMAATALRLGTVQTTAAAPWAQLGASVLGRTNFFHHRTGSVGHGDLLKSLRLSGGISRGELLPSLLASETARMLGTIQAQPITLGASDAGEALSYGGRGIPMLRPSSLKDVLTMPDGPLKAARSLRDETLDKLNAWYKKNATEGQASFLDRYANTQTDLRKVSEQLLSTLTSITTDNVAGQIAATVALLQLKATPVVSVHIPFGGDNHDDTNLAYEANEYRAGVASIGSLMDQLAAANLADSTSFVTLNVFGRTLAARGLQGRDHNEDHHASVLIGKNFKPGVTGGIAANGLDYTATSINASTGAGGSGQDIAANDSFAALAKTLGAGVGVSSTFMDDRISAGKVVGAAVST